MSNSARKESTVGEIVNLMSVDVEHLQNIIPYLWCVWSSPLQIGVALYFLYQTVGYSMFAGLGVMILLLPLNGFIMSKIHALQEKQMKQKDNRIKLLSEVLNGIKILKLYAWEMSFKEKILAIRNMELKILWKSNIIGCGFTFSWTVAPYVVSLATFATFIFTSSSHYLDAQTAFVAISLFNILRFAINLAPMIISEVVKASVSLRRLNKFLVHDDIDLSNVQHDYLEDHMISIKEGTFMWDPEIGPALKNINLGIPEGSLVAVVGQVGSGKSSIISAMLGEMIKVKGQVNVRGSVAYVPQQAWIQNASLQDNVLFGKTMDSDKYKEIIEACALKPDLDILPAGDKTEIGEKGINLSGGQKQRVSLARAVYHDSDIYYLDDPLSAVDSHVGKHIFEQVVGNKGLLRKKTRVLVTHGVQWLPRVDRIIVMVNGAVSEIGTYDELLDHAGAFAEFLQTYLTQEDSKEGEEEDQEAKEVKAQILQRLTSITSDDGSDTDGQTKKALKRQISRQMSTLEEKKTPVKEEKEEKPDGKEKLIEEEKAEVGSVKLAVFLSYAKAIGVWYFALVMLFYGCFQGCSLFSNVWLSEWTEDPTLINRSLGPPNSSIYREQNDYYLGIYGGLGIGQAICIALYAMIFVVRSINASKILHQKMLHNVVRSPMSFFDTTPSGRIVNRFSFDIDAIDNELPMQFEMFLDCLFIVVGTLIVISFSTPFFMILIVPLGFFYFLIQRFYVSTSRQLKRLESKTRSPIYSHFGETVAGASVIRAYGAQSEFVTASQHKVDANQQYQFVSFSANRWLGTRLEFLGNIVIMSAALFAVAARDSNTGISGGVVGLSISYALQITENLNWFVRMTSELETQIVCVERVQEYTERPVEADLINPRHRPPPGWPSKGAIHFRNYTTRYREGLDPVLKGIEAYVKPGEKIGIVGRTGAGKSSLALALFRLIEPTGGAIVVDDEDLYNFGLHDCRSKLTILPQEPVLFSGSLRMNLDPVDDYTDQELWTALEHAHLKSFVQGLPAKLEYDCGEGGQNFSVGQRQLLCLARSLLRKTKILVLDEATAAVDLETDDLIQDTIRKEFSECTVLTIAHRLNTVMDYDRIMVLQQGEIKEFDSPSVLLQNTDGIFYSLAKDAGLV
ncbi:hypothetical protein FSP39_007607 [Pinctada imbricata]|uniref:ABC-type glutathione-S-conjugate transporter n=1 Tax=Pinctada imbricata TaxID=66713 RepID=A0AA88YHV5_PINIB|nr:hypothetical protein FSP39_007607 [Pinctada imbricata]